MAPILVQSQRRDEKAEIEIAEIENGKALEENLFTPWPARRSFPEIESGAGGLYGVASREFILRK